MAFYGLNEEFEIGDEFAFTDVASYFYVNEWDEVLLFNFDDVGHIGKLFLPWCVGAIEVVATYAEAYASCFADVACVAVVNESASFCSFDIYVGNGLCGYLVPVDVVLVV